MTEISRVEGEAVSRTVSESRAYLAEGITGPEMYAGQEATIRTGHGTTDWFQWAPTSPSREKSWQVVSSKSGFLGKRESDKEKEERERLI